MTIGKIKRSLSYAILNTKKGVKKGPKKGKKPSGSNSRDYRGPNGVLEDAQK